MGAKDTMKTFFAAMNEQVAPTGGYGPRIIATPMGPFSWNDNLGVWVNTNNGMQLNNIAFQDMYAMMDYETMGGGIDYKETWLPIIILNIGNISSALLSVNSKAYAGVSGAGPVGTLSTAGTARFRYYGSPTITVTRIGSGGANPKNVYYSTNGVTESSFTGASTSFVGNNDVSVRVGIGVGTVIGQTGAGNLYIAVNGITSATIPYSFTISGV